MSFPLIRPSRFQRLDQCEGDPASACEASELDRAGRAAWIYIPYRRIAYVLLGATGAALLACGIYGSTTGWTKYQNLTRPHRYFLAPAGQIGTNSAGIVRPFFAPRDQDGQEDIEVAATIWFRDGVLPEAAAGDDWQSTTWRTKPAHHGELGYLPQEVEHQEPWQRVWTKSILKGKVQITKQEVHEITLPGHMIRALVMNPYSRLIVTFAVLPPAQVLAKPLFGVYQANSTRPAAVDYGVFSSWPRNWDVSTPLEPSQSLYDFFTQSGAGYDLRYSLGDSPGFNELNLTLQSELFNQKTKVEDYESVYLMARTWLTLADTYPVYDLAKFREGMATLRERKQGCRGNEWVTDVCLRAFAREGHFENLLQHTSASNTSASKTSDSHWRYGPFITTRLSTASSQEYIKLPKYTVMNTTRDSTVEDLIFNWHVTYSAISPAKLSLVDKISGSWRSIEHFLPMWPPHEMAQNQDYLELFNAFLGHHFDPNTRPISRSIVGGLANVLQWLGVMSIFLYWYTRLVTAGIAIEAQLAQTGVDFLHLLVQSGLNFVDVKIPLYMIKVLGFTVLIVLQVVLWLHIEIKQANLVPRKLRFRIETSGESRTKKAKQTINWKIYMLIGCGTFIALRMLPSPPAIVHAPDYEEWEVMHPRDTWFFNANGGYMYTASVPPWAMSLFWHRTMDCFQQAAWLVTRLAQIHLNCRCGTFAGMYGITAYLNLASLSLFHITSIAVRWFGRSESMQAFRIWDVVTMLVEGGLAAQACRLPKIDRRDLYNEVFENDVEPCSQ